MTNATVRANAQALLIDRRTALGSLAAAGALFALPKIGNAKGAPSPVSRAYAEFQTADAAWLRACEAEDDAFSRYEAPELPSYHPFRDAGGHLTETQADGSHRLKLSVSDENLRELRSTVALQLARPDPEVGESTVRQVRQTIAKIEAHREEHRRRRAAAGLDVAEAACEASQDARDAAVEAVLALVPGSLGDLAMQADVALCRGADGDETRVLNLLVAFAGPASAANVNA